jgi:hypothetical protein
MTNFTSLDLEHKQHLLTNLVVQEKLISFLNKLADSPEDKAVTEKLIWKFCQEAFAAVSNLSKAEVEEKVQKVEAIVREQKLRQVNIRAKFS